MSVPAEEKRTGGGFAETLRVIVQALIIAVVIRTFLFQAFNMIARKHLIPHSIAKHGLRGGEWAISDKTLLLLIRRYTREAGVRNLERELSSLIRKAVKELALHNKQSITVEADTVADYLGVPKFRSLGTQEDGDLRQVGTRTDRSSRRAATLSAAHSPDLNRSNTPSP
jgi:hypothetical protein